MGLMLQAEQLDEATRAYLREVRDHDGQNLPGMYVPDPPWLPIWGIVVGAVLIALTLIGTLWSLQDPLRVACLQTAGLLVGGWCMAAPVRMWWNTGGKSDLGNFYWFDPQCCYHTMGYRVSIQPIEELVGLECTHVTNDGSYDHSDLEFITTAGKFTLRVTNFEGAEKTTTFYNVLLAFQHEASKTGLDRDETERAMPGRTTLATLPLVEQGLLARTVALTGGLPADGQALEPRVSELPTPHVVGAARGPWLAYLTIVLAGGLCFAAMFGINQKLRDEAFFEAVKDQNAPMLRAYLIDPRNVDYRLIIQDKLNAKYRAAQVRINQRTRDRQLAKGLETVVDSLRDTIQPIVTVRVTPADQTTNDESLANQFTQRLLTVIDDELIGFAQGIDGVPALMEATYRWDELKAVEWKFTFRVNVDDAGVVAPIRVPLLVDEAQRLTLGGRSFPLGQSNTLVPAGPAHRPTVLDATLLRALDFSKPP